MENKKLDLKPFVRNGNELYIDKEKLQGINVKYRELSDQLKDADELQVEKLKEEIKKKRNLSKKQYQMQSKDCLYLYFLLRSRKLKLILISWQNSIVDSY